MAPPLPQIGRCGLVGMLVGRKRHRPFLNLLLFPDQPMIRARKPAWARVSPASLRRARYTRPNKFVLRERYKVGYIRKISGRLDAYMAFHLRKRTPPERNLNFLGVWIDNAPIFWREDRELSRYNRAMRLHSGDWVVLVNYHSCALIMGISPP